MSVYRYLQMLDVLVSSHPKVSDIILIDFLLHFLLCILFHSILGNGYKWSFNFKTKQKGIEDERDIFRNRTGPSSSNTKISFHRAALEKVNRTF